MKKSGYQDTPLASVASTNESENENGHMMWVVESASARLGKIYEEGGKAAGGTLEEVIVGVEEAVEEVGEAASRAVEKVKEKYEGVRDEL